MRFFYTLVFASLLVGCGNDYDVKPTDEPAIEAPEEKPPVVELGTPQIAVEPAVLDFGLYPKNCRSDIRQIKVKNIGDADLDVSKVAVVGSDRFNFRLNGYQPFILPPGQTHIIDAGFFPTDGTSYGVNVQITSNDPDDPTVDVEVNGDGGNDQSVEESWNQTVHDKSDTLWVIDNSCSMSDDVQAMSNAFDTFIQQFVNLGLDYQIGVITTDMDDPAQSGKLLGNIIHSGMADPVQAFNNQANQGAVGSATEKGLLASKTALTAPLINNQNAGLIRPDSVVSVIVISDETDAGGINPTNYANWLEGYQGGDPDKASFSGVVGPPGGPFSLPCNAFGGGTTAQPAQRYHDAINATDGAWADFCSFDYQTILQLMGQVAAGLKIRFKLSFDPVTTTIVVEVNGQVVPEDANNGWTYNGNTNKVIFHGNAVPPPGASIDISYDIASACN